VRAVQKRVRSPLHFEPEPKKAHRRDRAGLSETGGS
jgi:DNA-binding transcriptional LysR family regulator